MELEVPCEQCGKDVAHALCDRHLDNLLQEKYEEGFKDGKEEGIREVEQPKV